MSVKNYQYLKTEEETQSYTKAFQNKALEGVAQMPPFLAVDMEGGCVNRFKEYPNAQDYQFPSAHKVAQLSIQDAEKCYRHMAQKLKMCGFNLNFAPVVDIDYGESCPIIGRLERSFGHSVEEVTRYAKVFIQEMRAQGILTSLKHFPGHGSAKGDSHAGFVDVSQDWTPTELEPFFGLSSCADMVMTAHIFNASWDPQHPATLSKKALSLLRRNGFKGVIVGDDMHMGAILENYSFEEGLIKGLQAGIDCFIYSHNKLAAPGIKDFSIDLELPERFASTILDAIKKGILKEKTIQESFQRIQTLKKKLMHVEFRS